MTYTETTAADATQRAEKTLDGGAPGDFSLVAAIAERSELRISQHARHRRVTHSIV